MTRRRWIADEVDGDRAALVGAHAGHLVRVLRARVGQQFEIAAGERVRRGIVANVSDDRVEFSLAEDVEMRSSADVTVLLSVFKFDRMEWAIEKCTELGASRVVPVIARRTDIHLAKAAEKRVERWKRIAVQAAEQSRRAAPPDIASPEKLSLKFLAGFAGVKIVLAESEQELALKDAVAQSSEAGPISVAVGPEGGWTEDELNLFAREHWVSASLGSNILRAETAAIAALAIVMSEISI